MTLPINVELVKGSPTGAVDTDLLKGAYVKSVALDNDTGVLTLVCQDADGNETTLNNLRVEVIRPHTRYAAVKANTAFVEADFTGALGVSSMEAEITLPDYSVNAYIAFAVPDSTPDLTDILQGSATQFNSFIKLDATISIGGIDHNVWRSVGLLSRFFAQTTWTVVQ